MELVTDLFNLSYNTIDTMTKNPFTTVARIFGMAEMRKMAAERTKIAKMNEEMQDEAYILAAKLAKPSFGEAENIAKEMTNKRIKTNQLIILTLYLIFNVLCAAYYGRVSATITVGIVSILLRYFGLTEVSIALANFGSSSSILTKLGYCCLYACNMQFKGRLKNIIAGIVTIKSMWSIISLIKSFV